MTRFPTNTHKRIHGAWCYGAGFIGLAKRYGWRKVRETQRIIFKFNNSNKANPNDSYLFS
ncbi:MAG: hypothetical protein ACRDDF_10990 [Aeromonas sp.]